MTLVETRHAARRPRQDSTIRNRKRLLGASAMSGLARYALIGLAGALSFAGAASAQSLPTGGSVSAGAAAIATGPGAVTITQTSQAAAINWDSFNIGQGNSVAFVQPNASAVALNRVVGNDPSAILGNLSANGQVFLINPNGVIFGQGARVDVGGLVASTLGLADADFMAGRYKFSGESRAGVANSGSISARDGGYVALLGADVRNDGTITAQLGTVALAGGQAVTLDVAGDGLLNVTVDTGAVNALVQNGGLIRADGGKVLLTAQSAGQLLRTVVNNSGVIEARTLQSRSGKIFLLGDMVSGTANVSGRLDASAPAGGDGGFIETSAASVNVADGARITTAAAQGVTGTWLIDPADFVIAANGGNISGSTLSAQLVTNSVSITTIPLPGDDTPGEGNIFVNDAIAWTASGTPTTLSLTSPSDVNINAPITATNGNLYVCCGRDVNVNAAITTTNGSVLLNAGRNVHVLHAITTTDGNIALCAGHDVHIEAKITLTRGTTIPARSLGLPVGLTLIAGASGIGPDPTGGTIIFAPLAPPITVTVAPVTINYNPISYGAPTDFSIKFVLTEGAALTQRMLLFPNGDKAFDGTDSAVLNGFRTTALSGTPAGVSLVAGPGATARFDDAAAGTNVGITFTGYTLDGANAGQFALASSCCSAAFRTIGSITATPDALPPGGQPPTTAPPVVGTPVFGTPVFGLPGLVPLPGVVAPGSQPLAAITPVGVAPPAIVPPGVVTQPGAITPPVFSAPGAGPTLGASPLIVITAPPLGMALPVVFKSADSVQIVSAERGEILRQEATKPALATEDDAEAEAPLNAFLPAPVVPDYPRKQARH